MQGRWEAVVWDFNGTLVDDVDLALSSINQLLARRGLPAVSRKRYRSVFGFPLADCYRRLGIDMSRETMEGLANEFHAAYLPGLRACSLQVGARETLQAVARTGARQFVLSALEETALRQALGLLDIAAFFDGCYGLVNRLADSKLRRAQELSSRHCLCGARTLFVGDMDHDAEVAVALGAQVALVARGHQNAGRLRACGYRVFKSLEELRRELVATALL